MYATACRDQGTSKFGRWQRRDGQRNPSSKCRNHEGVSAVARRLHTPSATLATASSDTAPVDGLCPPYLYPARLCTQAHNRRQAHQTKSRSLRAKLHRPQLCRTQQVVLAHHRAPRAMAGAAAEQPQPARAQQPAASQPCEYSIAGQGCRGAARCHARRPDC